ncbi:Phox homologous domain-containing protein [Stachybotrys elegans]|uniref:Endosomal/vacuolar adapter protein YPT35 n=1 Tax=Stachybotrys elegans TaxID=80388 RepID=A0A8K0WQW1_9HYPO|nr:Phox homologous domain-containing protein [Stachybotrys elegans]
MASTVGTRSAHTVSDGGPSPARPAETTHEPTAAASAAVVASTLVTEPMFQDDSQIDHHTADDASQATLSPSSLTSPVFWQTSSLHRRTTSNMSAESVLPAGAITLRDNETSDYNDRNSACWAKRVEVNNYTVVNGSSTNIGAFVVWNIRVETLSGSYMSIRKRYSEFDDFRRQLCQSFPNSEAAVPTLPPKSVVSKFRPRFLEKRRAGLQYFLNCILLNPEFSGSPVLKDFLFA